MTPKGTAVEKPTIGRIMRIQGIALDLVRVDLGDRLAWRAIVSGEPWIIYQEPPLSNHGKWRAYTEDHLTGSPRMRFMSMVVRWILKNQEEWRAKLAVRREKGTRMVDPGTTTKKGLD